MKREHARHGQRQNEQEKEKEPEDLKKIVTVNLRPSRAIQCENQAE